MGSTAREYGLANGRLSSGVQVAPASVLLHSGRASIVAWNGRTSGKAVEFVAPAT